MVEPGVLGWSGISTTVDFGVGIWGKGLIINFFFCPVLLDTSRFSHFNEFTYVRQYDEFKNSEGH